MTTETHNQICPVCDSPIKNGSIEFCPKCNWELVVITNQASTELKQYLDTKIKLHKETFLKSNSLREEVSLRIHSIEALEKENNELTSKIKILNSELSNKSEEFQKVKAKAEDTQEKQNKILKLEKIIIELEAKVEHLKINKLIPPI